MATKSPAKGKKPASSPSPSKDKTAKKPAKAVAKPAGAVEPDEERDDDDDEDDDDMEAAPAKPAAKKPATPAGKPSGAPLGGEPPSVVPARRLTPEAKAKVNEMVKKGMPLGDALKVAASWETFVAPVKDEPAKLVQGKSFEGGRPRRPREEDEEPSGSADLDDEEPAGAVDAGEE